MSFGEAGIAQQPSKDTTTTMRQSSLEYFPLSIEGFGPGSIHEAACQRRVLILRGIPESVPQQEITDLFNRPGAPSLKNISYAGNSRWYLVFENEHDAREANFMLNRDIQVICNRPIKACFKHSMPLFQQKQVFEQHIRHQMFMSAPPSHVSSPVPPPSSNLTAGTAAVVGGGGDTPAKEEAPLTAAAANVYPQFPAQFNVIPAFPGQFVSAPVPAALHLSPFPQGGVFAASPQHNPSLPPIAAVHLALGGGASNQLQQQGSTGGKQADRRRTLSVQTAAERTPSPSTTDDATTIVPGGYDGDEPSELLMESKVFTSSRLLNREQQQQDTPSMPHHQSAFVSSGNEDRDRHAHVVKRPPLPRQQPPTLPPPSAIPSRLYAAEPPLPQRRSSTLPRRSNTAPRAIPRAANTALAAAAAARQNDAAQAFSYAAALKTGLQPGVPAGPMSGRR